MKQIRFVVSGNVHSVNFRYFSTKKAKGLNLMGFVRNVPEGVEVVLEGKEKAIDEFIKFCRTCPGYSEVKGIKIKDEGNVSKPSFKGFQINY